MPTVPLFYSHKGDLESRIGDVSLGGKFVGDLHYDTTKHTPILIIGHHILHGKVVDCERPFVAIEKKSSLATREGTYALTQLRTTEWLQWLRRAVVSVGVGASIVPSIPFSIISTGFRIPEDRNRNSLLLLLFIKSKVHAL